MIWLCRPSGRTEIAFDRGHALVEGAEDEAREHLDLQRLQAVLGDVEVLGHAAPALDAVAKRDALQLAVQAIAPGMVDAGQHRRVAFFLQADQRTLVGAAVDHRVDLAFLVARHDHRGLADAGQLEVARLLHVELETKEIPHRPVEDARLLERIDLRVGEQSIGNLGYAAFRPDEGLGEVFRRR